jgi:hypothetical protein
MADENQLLQEEMQRLRDAAQGTGESLRGVETAARKSSSSLLDASKGLASMAKSVGQGDTSFKALNGVVDIAANAMAGLAKSIPFAGEGLAAGIKATAEASKFMLEQMDNTTQAFNDLGKVGALTADGMSGLQRQFVASGLQLNVFKKQVGENAIALARFRGMTGEGAEAFSEIAGKLTRGGDDSLRRLGMSSEQIGESVGAFIGQQTRLGRAQTLTNKELTDGTKRYAIELDSLSKVTGLSRDAIIKQQDAALSESRFRASINSLNEQQQKDLLRLQTVMNTFGSELGQGTRDLVSGAANTEAARKLMVDTGGAAQDIISRLKAGDITAAQAQKEMQSAVQANLKAGEQYSQFVDQSGSVMGNFASKADLATAKFDENGNLVKKTQAAQISGADKLTNETVAAQKSMEGLNIEMQKLGFTFLPQAATAVASMTSAMEKFVKYVNDTIGGGATEPTGSGQEGISGEFGGDAMWGGGDAASIMGVANDAEIAAAKKSVASGAGASVAPPTVKKSQQDLKKIGLRIKEGDVQAQDADISPKLIEMARKIQETLPGFAYFSGFNDKYHQDSGTSKHPRGLALDFALGQAPTPEEGKQIAEMLRSMGASYVQDEYNNPSSRSTAGHFHAEVSAAKGAILSGPASGYKPNLTMHGTEAVVPLNQAGTATAPGLGMDPGLMSAQLAKLDELVSVMKNQLAVSSKLLSYSS